jgi:hypothetical protein
MAITIASGVTISTAANTKSNDLITGMYQFTGKGKITLVARGSAAGMNCTLAVGGVTLHNDLPIPYFGATGALSINDHVVVSQVMNGGRVEFFLRNTSGGALTTDYTILFEPSGR